MIDMGDNTWELEEDEITKGTSCFECCSPCPSSHATKELAHSSIETEGKHTICSMVKLTMMMDFNEDYNLSDDFLNDERRIERTLLDFKKRAEKGGWFCMKVLVGKRKNW
jgi:hypothetical protein